MLTVIVTSVQAGASIEREPGRTQYRITSIRQPMIGHTAQLVTRIQKGVGKKSSTYLGWDLPTAAERVSAGLPVESLETIRRAFDLTNQEFAELVQISVRTLARRKAEKTLPPDESERVYRVGRLAELASRVLGGEENARTWMKEPNFALGDATPLDYARTEPGAELVERLLGRIEHGIPV